MGADDRSQHRAAPLNVSPDEFREAGHRLVDRIADFLGSLPRRPVTPAETAGTVRGLLPGPDLPREGLAVDLLLEETAGLLFDHSLHNGHPRFWGYITSSASPVGALGDLLAAAVNSNVGAWELSPVASEIESQTIRWIAQLIGYPPDCGGLLVSGGNMANFIGFLAARRAKTGERIRERGLCAEERRLMVYASRETHTWIQKAADLFGLGIDAIRWVETDANLRMDVGALEDLITTDIAAGHRPFIAVGAAGTVSTGAVDPLPEIGAVCRRHGLWFHVDGAYGAPAAALPEASPELRGLEAADSLALDPHKWLYSPLEAGCTLVRDVDHLVDAFSFLPVYYRFERDEAEPGLNFYELGMQNSRGFRALKVWLGLRRAGRSGYEQMIRDDIALAELLFEAADADPELEAVTRSLSIATFRYRPSDLAGEQATVGAYLNELNERIQKELSVGGEVFVSNAVVDGRYLLRACIVNFRSGRDDIEALPGIVVREGRRLDRAMRPAALGGSS